jgi:DNA-binding NarL/FixJ family response regulator
VHVLIVDAQELHRRALADLITQAGYTSVGQVGTYAQAMGFLQCHHCDLLILDLYLPESDPHGDITPANGLVLLGTIAETWPHIRCLIYTWIIDHDQLPQYLAESWKAGACGFVEKSAPVHHFLWVLDEILRGENSFTCEQLRTILQYRDANSRRIQSLPKLTLREREVLALLAEGYSNQEIAVRLGIASEQTVRKHRERIYTSLQVHNLAAAIRQARDWGFVS